MSMQAVNALLCFALSLLLAPLLPGVINRVKAIMGGRQGRPLMQLYYDLYKLVRKRPVYSHTTSFFFILAPLAGVASGVAALVIVPFSGSESLLGFQGDFVLLAGLFALARFTLIVGALDTGSAFEGMGAAREALFSALAEPLFLFCLLILGHRAGSWSLQDMLAGQGTSGSDVAFYLMIAVALFLIMLLENSRIPVDDPSTHLELTMIHEVMILDHSGPDLALLEYAAALKLWIFCLLISGTLLPSWLGFTAFDAIPTGGQSVSAFSLSLVGTLVLVGMTGAAVGLVESLMARMRLERVPQVLTVAASFAGLAALMLWR